MKRKSQELKEHKEYTMNATLQTLYVRQKINNAYKNIIETNISGTRSKE